MTVKVKGLGEGSRSRNSLVTNGRALGDLRDLTTCGVRVLLNQELSLVEAAHLIPFGVSRNDKPTNGMALCPNHHWAMDRHLIAPCPDDKRRAGVWRILLAAMFQHYKG